MKRRSLRGRILGVTALCFALFLLVEVALLAWYNHYREQEVRAFLNEALEATGQKIGDMDSRLRSLGAYLTVHPMLAEAYRAHSGTAIDDRTVLSIFDIARMTVSASDVVEDMVVVSREGTGKSYVSGLGTNLVDLMRPYYNYADAANTEPRYFFFPEHHFPHDALFAFAVPILDVEVMKGDVTKVGTIILACRMSALTELMNYQLQRQYAGSIVDARGITVATHPSGGTERQNHPYVAARHIGAMDVTLSVSMESGASFGIGFFLPVFLTSGLFFILTQLIFSKLINSAILRPVNTLAQEMPLIHEEQAHARLTSLGIGELDIIVDSANAMIQALEEASQNTLKAKTQLIETELRRNEAELYALQSQINPHFLFNTMQCMRALAVVHGAQDVASIATAMAGLLRYAIGGGDMVRVADEVKVIGQYLLITDIRYQNRFAHTIDIPQDILNMSCIKMMIQPLVENAVMHGVSLRESGGSIHIRGYRDGEDVLIEVRDDGVGMAPDRLAQINGLLAMGFHEAVTREEVQSFGLYNIHRRMQLAFGERYGLTIESVPGDTCLRLRMPG